MLHYIKKRKKDTFEYILYFFAIMTPLFELPQAFIIYQNKSAKDVSAVTWAFFLISNIIWIIYGIRRKLIPIILMYMIYMVVGVSIVIGIILYR